MRQPLLAASLACAVVLVASCSGSPGKGKPVAESSSPATGPTASGATATSEAGAARGSAPIAVAAEGVPEAAGSSSSSPPLGLGAGWGDNHYFQLGDGTSCARQTQRDCQQAAPTAVVGPGGAGRLSSVRSLAGGGLHTLALQADRTVMAWGRNTGGQLGNGTFGPGSAVPVGVVGSGGTGTLKPVMALGAGGYHSLAVTQDGRVWAWGDNIWGQLGVGTTTGPQHCPAGDAAPAPPGGPPSPDESRQGASNGCALSPTAVVGPNGAGQFDGVAAVAGGDIHSVALRKDGTVWTWGLNDTGQLGIGTFDGPDQCKVFNNVGAFGCSTKPVQVVGPDGTGHLSNIKAIAAGENFTLALRSDGTVWAWGSNAFNDLGQTDPKVLQQCNTPNFGPILCATKPIQVVGPGGNGVLNNVTAVAAEGGGAGLHALVLRSDGTVWGWGIDDEGQLGDGKSSEFETAPVQVVGPDGTGALSDVRAIAAGGRVGLAVKGDGSLWAWGWNLWGQLGIGDNTGPEQCTTEKTACSTKPVQVHGVGNTGLLSGVVSLAPGNFNIEVATRS